MTGFDSAFEQVKILVEHFSANEKMYLAAEYSEARVRTDFIDKFFTALGWDVNHNVQLNPYEQEVSIEKPVKVEGMQQKRADYAFFLAPNYRKDDVKFYVEAKKPARNLSNVVDYFQTCRYGWSAGTPLAILTDFEELHILDCRTKPDITTILDTKRDYFHYKDYLDKEKFAKVYWLFSREAVANNSIEKYVEQLPKLRGKGVQKKRGYESIDEVFLEELDGIRTTLAKAFKKNNPHLGSDELTEMTQRTIDRLVFIRFLEDKQIEPEHYISEFGGSKTAWNDFIYASRKLDAKYNGIVFKKTFIDEKNFIEPNDSDFAPVCKELSHVNSPYNFDLIPIHILGSIYERFLGKVVVATDKRVRIDEKPEVRKAGGVYYTPQYIVNYIVENTVGKLIDGKTPKEIAKLRFADISCGSGSFLITVFDKLLEYHKKYYQNNPKEAKSASCYEVDGKWVLSLKQKQKILTNNIYGVDIDAQAVEVTQLSLYLKLLEDESNATAEETWVMFKEQILPSLSDNIICGNSLIGTDISSGTLFNWEEEKKLKPMNFEDAFPKIMKAGGFDAVVGNPPYGAELSQSEKNYLNSKYKIQTTDTAALFIDKANNALLNNGRLSYIIPKPFLYADGWDVIRNKYLMNLETVIDCGKVWKKVKLEQVIIFETKDKIFKEYYSGKRIDQKLSVNMSIDKTIANHFGLIISDLFENEIKLGTKVKANGNSLGSVCDIKRGLDIQDSLTQDNVFQQIYRSKSIGRYELKKSNEGITKNTYSELKPIISYMEKSKIVIQNIVAHVMNPIDHIILMATMDEEGILGLGSVGNIFVKNESVSPKFIIALLNSKLFSWFAYRFIYGKAIRTMRFDQHHLNKFSLPSFEVDKMVKSVSYNKLILSVDQIIVSNKQLHLSKTDSEKEYLEKKCKGLDRQIDALVYELYGLTEEEIKIIEGT
jgi:hypothetical protein